jgi:hypothetical protein
VVARSALGEAILARLAAQPAAPES